MSRHARQVEVKMCTLAQKLSQGEVHLVSQKTKVATGQALIATSMHARSKVVWK